MPRFGRRPSLPAPGLPVLPSAATSTPIKQSFESFTTPWSDMLEKSNESFGGVMLRTRPNEMPRFGRSLTLPRGFPRYPVSDRALPYPEAFRVTPVRTDPHPTRRLSALLRFGPSLTLSVAYAAVFGVVFRSIFRNGLIFANAASAVRPCF